MGSSPGGAGRRAPRLAALPDPAAALLVVTCRRSLLAPPLPAVLVKSESWFGRDPSCDYSFARPRLAETDLYKQYSKRHFAVSRVRVSLAEIPGPLQVWRESLCLCPGKCSLAEVAWLCPPSLQQRLPACLPATAESS